MCFYWVVLRKLLIALLQSIWKMCVLGWKRETTTKKEGLNKSPFCHHSSRKCVRTKNRTKREETNSLPNNCKDLEKKMPPKNLDIRVQHHWLGWRDAYNSMFQSKRATSAEGFGFFNILIAYAEGCETGGRFSFPLTPVQVPAAFLDLVWWVGRKGFSTWYGWVSATESVGFGLSGNPSWMLGQHPEGFIRFGSFWGVIVFLVFSWVSG